MKLAEALALRSDLEKRFASLKERIKRYALVEQGDKPHEHPDDLFKEADGILKQWTQLVTTINRANLSAELADGRSLTEALAQRDALAKRHGLILAAIEGAQEDPLRYSPREIKMKTVVNVAKLQKQADDLSRRMRELNTAIQEANWTIELGDQRSSGRA
jgi:hypothetical protein